MRQLRQMWVKQSTSAKLVDILMSIFAMLTITLMVVTIKVKPQEADKFFSWGGGMGGSGTAVFMSQAEIPPRNSLVSDFGRGVSRCQEELRRIRLASVPIDLRPPSLLKK